MLKNLIKKLSVFLFIFFCLVPLTGCPPQSYMVYSMYGAINDDQTIINDTVYLFVGTDAKTWYGKYYDNYYIDEEQNLRRFNNIEIGMKIDSNEEYVTKYTISQDELFSSKYKYVYEDIIFDSFTENGTFRFNISGINIENNFAIIFSFCKEYYKYIYKHEFYGYYNEKGKFVIENIKRQKIYIDLETNEETLQIDQDISLVYFSNGNMRYEIS